MIKLDWTIFLQAANFFLLIGVLHLILFRPLGKVMQRRREEISGNLQKAEELDIRLKKGWSVYQEKISQAKNTISEERRLFRQNLAEEESRLLSENNEQALAELESVKDRVANEKEQALAEMKNKAEELSSLIAKKFLGRTL